MADPDPFDDDLTAEIWFPGASPPDPHLAPSALGCDRVFSKDHSRVATWRISRESDVDEERCLYDVTVEETATRVRIARVTRWWSQDRHTRFETGCRLVGVSFGASGALLLLKYEDGSREGIPLKPLAATHVVPAEDLLDPARATILVDQEPCSICGVAAWSKAVCDSCSTYCEKLLVSGGVGPRPRRQMREAHPDGATECADPRARTLSPPCGFCGSRGPLAVSGPLGHACSGCLAKLRVP